MKLPRVVYITLLASAGLLAASRLQAQRPAARSAVGVVDVHTVTRESVRFKQQLEVLKRESDASTASLKMESDRGNEMTAKLQKLPPDHKDRKPLEAQLLQMRADYELHGKQLSDGLRESEAKAALALTRELQLEISAFAQANGLQLVLRNDSVPSDMSDPRAMLQEMQKTIVYSGGADITPQILEAMNRRGPNTASKSQPPAKGPQR